ncbi:MAG: endonuclease III [Hyphomonadaceae bacterium]|nr:MAG: endonuclease III [Hyphomonadaceae bacterium]
MPKQIKSSTLSPVEIEAIFAQLSQDRPNPKTELVYTNPFTLLCAVALSAQATDVGVNKATKALFEAADTPQKMLALGEEGVAEYVKTIGLWRNKAKNLIIMSRQLVDNFGSQVPQTREELVTLAGVGRKTANVVLNEVFGQPTIAVDTHIFRVANRTGMAIGKTPDEVEAGLEAVVPAKYKLGAWENWWGFLGQVTNRLAFENLRNHLLDTFCFNGKLRKIALL